MKLNSAKIRKWSRVVHRDLSFFFSGLVIIYSISGIVMNHRDVINPDFTVERIEYLLDMQLQEKSSINSDMIIENILKPLGEEGNYTKHYFPQEDVMKVFLKGGSNLVVNINNNNVIYESVTRRPIISSMVKLHYNPNRWWSIFSDIFAVSLIIITITGFVMVKGDKGLIGRGGIELIAGILIPILFLII